MAASSHEFLNGAALLETTLAPAALVDVLQRIELEQGRRRGADWADRTLDLDLLLYDDRVIDTPELTVPHPRMSFRRFVLEPAAEIAGDWLHPVLGWTIGQLRNHLDTGADLAAIVSPRQRERDALVAALGSRFHLQVADPPEFGSAARLWPRELTTWVRLPDAAIAGELRTSTDLPKEAFCGAAKQPKLSILLDGDPVGQPAAGGESHWATLAGQPGRGPTLRIGQLEPSWVVRDATAAVQAVWPHLGPQG